MDRLRRSGSTESEDSTIERPTPGPSASLLTPPPGHPLPRWGGGVRGEADGPENGSRAHIKDSEPSTKPSDPATLPQIAKGQRREPADDDVRFVSERIGWFPFAAPSGSASFLRWLHVPYQSLISSMFGLYCWEVNSIG